jgi:hypothetical protein
MAQSDQVVQNATFPTVRADINDNLAALYSQNSGNSAPAVTVAFQPWVDTSSNPPVWKVRNGSNTAWITIGVLDPAGFNAGGVTAIANGGTGATTAALALAALLPSQGGNAGKALVTSGSAASWGVVASGASVQVFAANGTYIPTASKTTFLVFATGGGGGGGNFSGAAGSGSGGGGGGTALRLYNATEMGSSASITIGGGGGPTGSGGSTIFTPIGTGLVITGSGGAGGITNGRSGGTGGGVTNSIFDTNGGKGGGAGAVAGGAAAGSGGTSMFGGGLGSGGDGFGGANGASGKSGVVLVLEW